ncbi:MAG: ferrous iron transport protein B [Puniceicoccales bacterium]|jgi:ferrous iron transport protein B|nr:ferrous iron transport protein B [Puniceicoccales bacterium]
MKNVGHGMVDGKNSAMAGAVDGVTIALLGQPNSGKSTFFNALTSSNQHVGNWPGKTVEQRKGFFNHGGARYTLVDLPGAYSLSAYSDEEAVTRAYISYGDADLICVMADASQLERSLFMLADYAGIKKPAMLVLNMMDIAAKQGKNIDCTALAKKLHIPVVPIVAHDMESYGRWYEALDEVRKSHCILDDSSLIKLYAKVGDPTLKKIRDLLPGAGLGIYSPMWIAAKVFEMDEPAMDMVLRSLGEEKARGITALVGNVKNGSLITGECKFKWIERLLCDAVGSDDNGKMRAKFSRFDRIATNNVLGKPLAIAAIIFGLIISFAIAHIPIFAIKKAFPLIGDLLFHGLTAIGAPEFAISLICNPVIYAVFFTCYMSCFVFGISLVFGLLEEVGYMARVSFVFDGTMAKFGLQGKAIMPFLTSFACNMGGVAGTRIMDSLGQRITTMAMLWVVPCSATWGVVAMVSGLFFGNWAILVIFSLFAVAALHLFVTSRIFGKALIKDSDMAGLIMELPPYHSPKWKNLFCFVFIRMGDVLRRGLKVVIVVAVIFWLLSRGGGGDIKGSIIHRIGTFIEPLTAWFGMRWQMFMAFLVSIIGKEASLGVMASIFGGGGNDIWSFFSTAAQTEGTPELASAMLSTISRPEALAFLYAFFFGVPCFMTVAATNEESRSTKWTLLMVAYYISTALILSATAFRVGSLFL